MAFIFRLLRFLIWVVLVSWSIALLRRLVNYLGQRRAPSNRDIDVTEGAIAQKLVRDPVCGMHIAPSLALSVKQGGEDVHFCSAECRDKYLGEKQKFVANA